MIGRGRERERERERERGLFRVPTLDYYHLAIFSFTNKLPEMDIITLFLAIYTYNQVLVT